MHSDGVVVGMLRVDYLLGDFVESSRVSKRLNMQNRSADDLLNARASFQRSKGEGQHPPDDKRHKSPLGQQRGQFRVEKQAIVVEF